MIQSAVLQSTPEQTATIQTPRLHLPARTRRVSFREQRWVRFGERQGNFGVLREIWLYTAKNLRHTAKIRLWTAKQWSPMII